MPETQHKRRFGRRNPQTSTPETAEAKRGNPRGRLPPADEHSSFLGRITTGPKGTIGTMDEAFERSVVGRNKPGKLIPVSPGRPGAGSRISVHGIDGAPDGVSALTKMAVDKGARASTFAYDDKTRRLGKSSDDLMAALAAEMKANPQGPLVIDAHSMGTRITLDAVRKLIESGQLGDRQLELNLIAPLLAGITEEGRVGTNLSRLALPGMGAIPGVRPGKDMGTRSRFQKQLAKMKLPKNVRTRLFTGTEDPQVDTTDEGWVAMKQQLGAEHHSFKGANHVGVVARAAEKLARE